MYRAKRLYILLGVLVVVCAAAFLALHMEERQEQIQNSGETVLEIDPDAVQTLSWDYEGESLSFHRDEGWIYDGDEAFPVDSDKIQELLEGTRLSLVDGAVLGALNIADAYFKEVEASENLRRQLKELLEESAKLKSELSEAKREIFKLQNRK